MRLLAFGMLGFTLSAATSAMAQSAEASAPGVAPSSPLGDRVAADPLSGFLRVAPLVLSLEASVVPIAKEFANCPSREDDGGNSTGGIPIHHSTEMRLTPKLVLSAFSQLGCPIDGGAGAAFTYAVPVRASTSQGSDSPIHMAARADVVWKTPGRQPYRLGIQSLGATKHQVLFGSGF